MKKLILLLASTALYGADVAGKWTGTGEFTNADGQSQATPVMMMLKQSGAEVTGIAGPSEDRSAAIRNGKLAGDKLTFEVVDNGATVSVELTLAGDSLKGEAKFQRDYGVIPMKLSLKRESAGFSGKWSGTTEFQRPDGQTQNGRVFLTLKQSGAEVTGLAGPSEDRMVEIKNGKVAGDKLTFEAEGDGMKVLLELTLANGALKGEAKVHADGGVAATLKLALKRD